jgi:hypothetical protein
VQVPEVELDIQQLELWEVQQMVVLVVLVVLHMEMYL